ncbi:phospholipid-transporting ATPase-like protein, putative [Medicago truncatula]|uniref:Phospholipid-transporting ATPase-like protein, putative n=1 Tax=Medicago truncatula TaxID=3880 RepID=G7JLQ4_MEDTR|nr:phospholipid-transporting ATPase-like protein, putative [Medicago truncatula]
MNRMCHQFDLRTSLNNSVILIAYNVFYTSVPFLDSVLHKNLSEETRPHHP